MPSASSAPIWQLTLARWRGFYREPSALFWSFGFPIVLSIVLGGAFRNRPPSPTDVAVLTGTPGSARALDTLRADPTLHVLALDPATAVNALRTGRVAIVVEPGDLAPTYRLDPTRPESRAARLAVDAALQHAAGRADVVHARDSLVTGVGNRYIDFLVPGLIGLGLLNSGLWAVGYVLVEMRTKKLMKRLVATPMRKRDLLGSFLLMRLLYVSIEVPILLGASMLIFGVTVRGSIALFAGLCALGAISFAAMGLLIASRAQNTQTVGGLINLFSMPMTLGSGIFFSSERFPHWVQPFIRALPLTAMVDALRAVMNDGAGPRAIARSASILAAWGLVCATIALRTFKWR